MMRTIQTRLFQYVPVRTVILLAIVVIAMAVSACSGGGDPGSEKPLAASTASGVAESAPPPVVPTPVVVVIPLTPEPPKPTSTPRPPDYRLALISSSCKLSSSNYMTCEGFVKNLTNQSMKGIEVVLSWYDDAGTPQSSHTGYVKFNPLLADQDSPWTTFSSHNPALKTYSVAFKETFGGTILTRDDRKR